MRVVRSYILHMYIVHICTRTCMSHMINTNDLVKILTIKLPLYWHAKVPIHRERREWCGGVGRRGGGVRLGFGVR